MRNLVYAVALCLAVTVLSGTAFGVDHYNVVVPRDSKSFSVDQTSIVRLHAHGAAKATIEAEVVSGPAKIVSVNNIFPRKGGEPVAGESKEYNLKSSGKGTVKVKITVTGADKGATPKVTTYEYEVK